MKEEEDEFETDFEAPARESSQKSEASEQRKKEPGVLFEEQVFKEGVVMICSRQHVENLARCHNNPQYRSPDPYRYYLGHPPKGACAEVALPEPGWITLEALRNSIERHQSERGVLECIIAHELVMYKDMLEKLEPGDDIFTALDTEDASKKAKDVLAVQEGPVEGVSLDGISLEDVAVEERPLEASRGVENASVVPVEEVTLEVVPVAESPLEASRDVESAPVESAPVESAPVESAPVDNVPVEETTFSSVIVRV